MSGWTLKVARWIEAEGRDFWTATAARLEDAILNEGDGGWGVEDEAVLFALARTMEDHIVVYKAVPRYRLSTVDFVAIAREYVPVCA